MGGAQHIGAGGIAEEDRQPLAGAHPLGIVVERQDRQAKTNQVPGQGLADLTEADHQHMVAQGRGAGLQIGQGGGGLALQAVDVAPDQVGGDRRDRHGQDHRDGQELDVLMHEQAGGRGQAQQHEGKLAALRQQPAQEQRLPAGKAEPDREAGEQQALEEQERRGDQDDHAQMLGGEAQIDGHADRHEEEAEQQAAEGGDVGGDLVAIFGIGDHQPGDEGAKGHRQAGLLGREAGREHHHQGGRREHLGRVDRGGEREQRPQQIARGDDHDDQDQDRAQQGHEQRQPDRAGRLAHDLDQDQQRADRDVLDQEDRDRHAAELGQRAAPVAQDLQHHRGRGQRQSAAHDHRPLRRQAKRMGHGRDHHGGHQELGDRQDIDPRLEQPQALELQLQTKGEQQEDDAQIGQRMHRLQIRDHGQARGPDRDAADQKAQHGAEPQPIGQRGKGDEKQQDDQGFLHPLSPVVHAAAGAGRRQAPPARQRQPAVRLQAAPCRLGRQQDLTRQTGRRAMPGSARGP